MKHMKIKTVKRIYLFGILTLVLSFCFAASMQSTVFLAIDLFLIFALVVFFVIFFRCPRCGKFLGRIDGAYCPFCGKKLDED